MFHLGLQLLYLACILIETILASHLHQHHVLFYSGPTYLLNHTYALKSNIYHDNFQFLLNFGLNCRPPHSNSNHHIKFDVVIILSKRTYPLYSDALLKLNQTTTCDKIAIVVRRGPDCYDMGNYKQALKETNISTYTHFTFLNCGMLGPLIPSYFDSQHYEFWPLRFTSMLSDSNHTDSLDAAVNKVKLIGVSLNCERQIHVQSMLWSTDAVGMGLIMNSGSFFDCTLSPDYRQINYIIKTYELGISKAILEAGYQIRAINSVQQNLVLDKSHYHYNLATNSPFNCRDMWHPELKLSPYDTIFFKVSRYYSEEVIFYKNWLEQYSENLGLKMKNASLHSYKASIAITGK